MKLLVFSAVSLAQLVTSSVEMADHAPGRAVLWRPSSSSGSSRGAADYRTVSMEMPELNQLLDDHASKDEIVAVFRTADGRPVLAHDGVRGSIRAADAPMVFPNIYHAPLAEGSARLPFAGAHLLADAHQMNLAAFKDLLAARREDGPLFNGRVDSYEVTVTGDVADVAHFQAISALAGELGATCPMTFAAMDAPTTTTAAAAASAARPADAQYSRILATSKGSSNLLDGVYYKPEVSAFGVKPAIAVFSHSLTPLVSTTCFFIVCRARSTPSTTRPRTCTSRRTFSRAS